MHHKRGKAKNQRAGCLACKPHKANGAKGKLINQIWQEQVSRQNEKEQTEDFYGRSEITRGD